MQARRLGGSRPPNGVAKVSATQMKTSAAAATAKPQAGTSLAEDQSTDFLVVQNRSFVDRTWPDRCPGDRWFAMVSYLAARHFVETHGRRRQDVFEGRCVGTSGNPEERSAGAWPTIVDACLWNGAAHVPAVELVGFPDIPIFKTSASATSSQKRHTRKMILTNRGLRRPAGPQRGDAKCAKPGRMDLIWWTASPREMRASRRIFERQDDLSGRH